MAPTLFENSKKKLYTSLQCCALVISIIVLKSEVTIMLHILNQLHSSMNHLCNQSNHYEKYSYAKEATTKYFLLYKWNTKEDTGKSMNNAFYVL